MDPTQVIGLILTAFGLGLWVGLAVTGSARNVIDGAE